MALRALLGNDQCLMKDSGVKSAGFMRGTEELYPLALFLPKFVETVGSGHCLVSCVALWGVDCFCMCFCLSVPACREICVALPNPCIFWLFFDTFLGWPC